LKPELDANMIDSLLNFKSKLSNILNKSFARNATLEDSLKKSFEVFINKRKNKPAELIAKFVDNVLRSSNKSSSDTEVEELLDSVLVLFRYIHGKDVFEAFYKKDLAKRLLLNKSASVDSEKSILSKLKTECGPQFTNRLEGMFKDMELSRDLMSTFRESLKYSMKVPILDLTIQVLTQSYWPTYPVVPLNIPSQFALSQEVFKEFYMKKHRGRKLIWANSLGHCVVKASFRKSTKELSMSLFQTVVMLLFNDQPDEGPLDYTTIKNLTSLEDKELVRTLQSLACGKTRILTKSPKGKNVADTDTFTVNLDFTHNLYRIKVNTIQLKETVEEQIKTHKQVDQDRQYLVDAAIVRIMKTRKKLNHTQLVTEVFSQLKFPIEPSQMKKRIESLLDREYMERDESSKDTYLYLA